MRWKKMEHVEKAAIGEIKKITEQKAEGMWGDEDKNEGEKRTEENDPALNRRVKIRLKIIELLQGKEHS